MNKAVFLDKDGTIIKDIPYNSDPQHIKFLPGVIDSLQRLQQKDYSLFIITNQSGIARGLFSEKSFKEFISHINMVFRSHHLKITDFYYCPHFISGKVKEYVKDCDCRKPKPGLLKRAAVEYQIDLSNSWMIGDILDDIEAGNKAGCKTVLINNGNETVWHINSERTPVYMTKNFSDAAGYILSKNNKNE